MPPRGMRWFCIILLSALNYFAHLSHRPPLHRENGLFLSNSYHSLHLPLHSPASIPPLPSTTLPFPSHPARYLPSLHFRPPLHLSHLLPTLHPTIRLWLEYLVQYIDRSFTSKHVDMFFPMFPIPVTFSFEFHTDSLSTFGSSENDQQTEIFLQDGGFDLDDDDGHVF